MKNRPDLSLDLASLNKTLKDAQSGAITASPRCFPTHPKQVAREGKDVLIQGMSATYFIFIFILFYHVVCPLSCPWIHPLSPFESPLYLDYISAVLSCFSFLFS